MQQQSFNKFAKTLALVGIFMFSGVALFQLNIAFGWAPPTVAPPGGGGIITVSGLNVGINTPTPAYTLDVAGIISAGMNKVMNVTAPTLPNDAVNLAYLQLNYGGAQAGGGSGSLVLYYRTVNGVPQGPGGVAPSCAAIGTGWVDAYPGTGPWYGPHYLGVLAYDWLFGGVGGDGGGFGQDTATRVYPNVGPGSSGPPPNPPPPGFGDGGFEPLGPGYSYNLQAIAFGSDSDCSESQQSVVPVNQFYQNSFITANGTTFYADACSAGVNPITGLTRTECNLCVVCVKP